MSPSQGRKAAVTPAHHGNTVSPLDMQSTPIQTEVRPLTAEEKQRGWEALKKSETFIAHMRARQRGRPAAESSPLIREARQQRPQRH